jgi:hypothetical protein
MRRRKFNEYVLAEPAQPRAQRREAIAAWLRARLAAGPRWPNEITTEGRTRGYRVDEICGALRTLRGERDRVGQWILPDASSMETTI